MSDCSECGGLTPFTIPTGQTGAQGPSGPQGEQGPAGGSIIGPQGPPGVNASPKVYKYTEAVSASYISVSLTLSDYPVMINENLGTAIQATDYVISVKRYFVSRDLATNYWEEITADCDIKSNQGAGTLTVTFPTDTLNIQGYRITLIG